MDLHRSGIVQYLKCYTCISSYKGIKLLVATVM